MEKQESSTTKQQPGPTSEGGLQVLHITDTHLYGDPKSTLLGMNTLDSLQQVLAAAMDAAPRRPDFILATGDLVHDASAAGYHLFAEAVLTAGVPVHCLPGNHDDLEMMKSTLPSMGVSVSKSVEFNHWRILLLDSTVAGEEGGHLDNKDLEELEETARSSEKHILICMHHHPMPVGSQWIDRIGADNGEALFSRIREQSQIKAVLCGHVHQMADRYEQQVRVLATPSTCIQFEAGLDKFKISNRPPAARLLSLRPDGKIDTGLVELSHVPTGAQYDAAGY